MEKHNLYSDRSLPGENEYWYNTKNGRWIIKAKPGFEKAVENIWLGIRSPYFVITK